MNAENLSAKLDEFVITEVENIKNSIDKNIDIDSGFFDTKYTFYGKDYDGIGFKKLWGKKGIYIFFIDEEINLTYDDVRKFNDCSSGGKFKFYKGINLKKADCLYLGSSTSGSLYSRINQHFKKSDCYSSLHLQEKNRKLLKDKVKIVAFPVKNKNIKNLDMFLKCIEKELHETYKPLAGSKRV